MQSRSSSRLSRKLSGLRLAVVGCGALGSELCRRLAELGQRQVPVIDPDRLEPRNLALSQLFQQAGQGSAVVGRSKAQLAVQHALRLDVDSAWQGFEAEIGDVGLAELRACDLLLSCTDSTLARVETAFAARSLGLPMLDGGIRSQGVLPQGAEQGRVTWFAPSPQAACPLCALGESRRAEILAYALSPSLGCAAAPHFSPMSGTPAIIEAVAQAMLERLALSFDASPDQAPTSSSAEIISIDSGPRQTIQLTRGAGCPWHSFADPATLVALPPHRPFATSFAHLPAGTLVELPWPICLLAHCRACGQPSQPLRRTAYTRRRAHCPHCGAAGTLEPLESIDMLWPDHPLANRTPRQLGLPPNQLYRVRAVLRLQQGTPER